MIESRLFHLVSSESDGVSLEKIAEEVFLFRSSSKKIVENVLSRLIINDERFNIDHNHKMILSDKGEEYLDFIDTTFVAVDVETTGTNSISDNITEIGALKIESGVIVDKFETLVNPGRYIPFDIMNLTGISNEMVNEAPGMKDVMPDFLDFLGDAVFIAHNASFDLRFINSELEKLGIERLLNDVVCTYKLSKKIYPDLKKLSLKRISTNLGIINQNPHRAGSDAAVCAQIFIKMLKRMPKMGIFTLIDLKKCLQ
ncbi:PolC-type DNA polymerase III [candidate division KSB1 bacterium]